MQVRDSFGEGPAAGGAPDAGAAIDLVYQAALQPELWPDALESIRLLAGCDAAILMRIAPDRTEAAIINRGMEPALAEFVRAVPDPGARRSLRLAANHSGFLRDADYMDRRQLESDPSRRHLAETQQLGPSISCLLHFDDGGVAVFAMERVAPKPDFTAEEIAMLDGLRPHLLRACILSGTAWQRAAEDRVRTLDMIGYPAATLDGAGQVIAANDRCLRLLPMVARRRARLRLPDVAAQAALVRILGGRNGGSIVIGAQPDVPALVMHVLPVVKPAPEVFVGATWLAILLSAERGQAGGQRQAAGDLLEALYGLTPAEARVAVKLAEGGRVEEVAKAHGVSRETVRSQVRSILSKTGLARQADLAAILGAILLRR